jgi:hypothetical protein
MRLPRPSTALALVALAVALGRSDYAATVLPAGSIGATQLEDAAVVSGPPRTSTLTYVTAEYGPFRPHSQYTGVAACRANLIAVGGGVLTDAETPAEQTVNSSYPSDGTGKVGTTAWAASVDNLSSKQLGFTVYAICAPSASVSALG